MKKCLILFGVAVTSVHVAFAAHQLSLNTLGEMVVSDDAGAAVKTLAHGSVGEVVRSPEQSFKISYGKDLQGNPTTIIYANPEDPQPLNLGYNGKSISLSKDAVLTMVHDTNGVILQSGVLGQVTVDGTPMPPSSYVRISNSGTVMASAAPIAAVSATPSSMSAPISASVRRVKETPIETGTIVGRVFISNDGGPEEPLTENSVIKAGSLIRTEPGASVTLRLFPDTGTHLHEKSLLGITSYAFDNTPGALNRHVVLHLYKGKVHNDLDVKGSGATHYQVDTPHQNFVAIGTNFLVAVDEETNNALVQVHEGTVSANDGSRIHARVQALYTSTGRPPEFTPIHEQSQRNYENRSYSYGNRASTPATSATTTPDGYVKHDEHKENMQKLHMQALMTKGALKPITPVLPE